MEWVIQAYYLLSENLGIGKWDAGESLFALAKWMTDEESSFLGSGQQEEVEKSRDIYLRDQNLILVL